MTFTTADRPILLHDVIDQSALEGLSVEADSLEQDDSEIAMGFSGPVVEDAFKDCWERALFEGKQPYQVMVGAPGSVWVVSKGCFLGMRCAKDGRIKGGELFAPGDIVGLSRVKWKGAVKMSVLSLGDVQAYRIPSDVLEKTIPVNAELTNVLIRYMALRYRRLLAELHRNALSASVRERIEGFLGYASKRLAPFPEESLNLTELEIGVAVGAHPVTVCKILKHETVKTYPNVRVVALERSCREKRGS